ncbi:efflux RND transporter periplasmic adaptor subunit [Streptococcus rifensis]
MFKGKSKGFKAAVIGLSALVAAIVVAILYLGFKGTGTSQQAEAEQVYSTAEAKEGQLTSSTLLTGMVKADQEQYIYYDATKGEIASIAVNVGDQVQVGQTIVTYESADAQAAYDTAVRALNKVDRQIYELNTYGVVVSETGDAETDQEAFSSAQRTVDGQMQDLQDARADAASAVDKARVALDDANVKSTVAGTVVEVNRDVTKSTTSSAQTVVHIVNSDSLVVAGEMSEYNLANIKKDQDVTITSKVYPDKTWNGKVSYISDYPANAGEAASAVAGASSSGSSSKYPFKVALTSELGELKQGFTVSIQVNTDQKGIVVPVAAVLTDDDTNFYVYSYDKSSKKIKRVDVEVGNADGESQQVTTGLNAGDVVLADPTMDLKDGQEVTVNDKATD